MGFAQWMLRVRRNISVYKSLRIGDFVYRRFTGGNHRPAFYDIDATLPALRHVDAAYPGIREELERLLPQQAAMPRYHELDSDLVYSSARYHRQARWNVLMLYCYGSYPENNRALCPRTCAAIARVPHLNQAFFSILDPGKSIPAHTGPTQAYLRYHLGLIVTKNRPPSIRVRDQHYTWKEGESVLFDDSWDHEVINKSDGVRAVLILDVMRPFPKPVFAVNLVLRNLANIFYGPRLVRKANTFQLQAPHTGVLATGSSLDDSAKTLSSGTGH